ncbi:MAG: hypothetical protein ACTS3F_00490 [Phycisphaerales bacterium]
MLAKSIGRDRARFAPLALAAGLLIASAAPADPAIVLPRDYPRTDEPVRSGVPISQYFRMLRDNDPAYRIFAMEQLVSFELGDDPGEFGAGAINDRIERIAREDPHPGCRVMALHILTDRDAARGERLARAVFEGLERGTPAWNSMLSYLLCIAPEEFLPIVRERAQSMKMADAHRWYCAMALLMPSMSSSP